MKELTAERIARSSGGVLHMSVLTEDGKSQVYDKDTVLSAGPELCAAYDRLTSLEVSSITTDSRKAGEGALFAAIVGARVDGHSFISGVYDQGALCVISERELSGEDIFSGQARSAGKGLCRIWIRVEDTQTALGKVAAEYLRILKIPVVGITGSVGKTSTKEMIASVLSRKYRTLKTEGNFNNDLGLPLTIFRLTEEDEIAVLEMGISHFGDMHRLACIAEPDTAVITNIGTCHLEFLKDRDGVLRAKTEIFDHMKPGGRAVLNGNDDKLRSLTEVNGQEVLFFGVDSREDGAENLCAGGKVDFPARLTNCVCAHDIRSLGFEGSLCSISTPMGEFEARVPVPGIHNVSNAAAAAAVGLIHGLSFDKIREGIASMKTISGRFRILHAAGLTVIDDCYNANPVSMRASLKVLSECRDTRRVAVLGDMGELGSDEISMHRELGSYAEGCADRLVLIGKLGRHIYEAALEEKEKKGSCAAEPVWYETVDAFLENRENELKEGDTVLVKASHFMNFPKIVSALTAEE